MRNSIFIGITFSVALSLATVEKVIGFDSTVTTVYGQSSSGQCVIGDPTSVNPACSINGGQVVCHVVIYAGEENEENSIAYKMKQSGTTCSLPLTKNF